MYILWDETDRMVGRRKFIAARTLSSGTALHSLLLLCFLCLFLDSDLTWNELNMELKLVCLELCIFSICLQRKGWDIFVRTNYRISDLRYTENSQPSEGSESRSVFIYWGSPVGISAFSKRISNPFTFLVESHTHT